MLTEVERRKRLRQKRGLGHERHVFSKEFLKAQDNKQKNIFLLKRLDSATFREIRKKWQIEKDLDP